MPLELTQYRIVRWLDAYQRLAVGWSRVAREETAMQRLLQVVLSAWREAERVAAERPETSREHDAALVATERLRNLYGELLDSAKADDDTNTIDASPTVADLDARSN